MTAFIAAITNAVSFHRLWLASTEAAESQIGNRNRRTASRLVFVLGGVIWSSEFWCVLK